MIWKSVFAGMIAVCISGPSWAVTDADEAKLKGFGTLAGSEVSFSLGGAYSRATLTITGPDGFFIRAFSKTGNPSIDLLQAKAEVDGLYTYEITASTGETVTIRNPRNNGRGGIDPGTMERGISASGTFVVKGGLIVDTSSEIEPEGRK